MSDYFLLIGALLCLLSLPLAVMSLVATRPPRPAAIMFVLGCLALMAGAYGANGPLGTSTLFDAWNRIMGHNMVEPSSL